MLPTTTHSELSRAWCCVESAQAPKERCGTNENSNQTNKIPMLRGKPAITNPLHFKSQQLSASTVMQLANNTTDLIAQLARFASKPLLPPKMMSPSRIYPKLW